MPRWITIPTCNCSDNYTFNNTLQKYTVNDKERKQLKVQTRPKKGSKQENTQMLNTGEQC